MKLLRLLLPALVACAGGSCVVPFPHRTHLREGYSGTVVDRSNQRPVAGAKVVVDYGPETVSVTTRRNGRFRAKGKHIQHWALMLAPLRMSLFPERGGIGFFPGPQMPIGIEISKPGYGALHDRLSPDSVRPFFYLQPTTSRIP